MSGRFHYRAEFSVSGDPKALKTALLSLKPETGITGRHEQPKVVSAG